MEDFFMLSQRANINSYHIQATYGASKYVILYDDHRTLLNILFEIQKNKWIDSIPNLIYFDQHDDAVVPRGLSISDRLAILGNRDFVDINSKEFWSYTEFDLSSLDDDWLTAAFDFNFVNDAVCIGVRKDGNVRYTNERYKDEEIKHRLLTMSHLDWEIGNRGLLGDDFNLDDDSIFLRKLFNYNTKDPIIHPYILDFDLDCFATECVDGEHVIAWPSTIFYEKYVDNYKVKALMDALINNAVLITICREPGCCGGIGEAHKILSYLDDYFFNNGLKTRPID